MPEEQKPARFEFVADPEWMEQAKRGAEVTERTLAGFIRWAVNVQLAKLGLRTEGGGKVRPAHRPKSRKS